MTKKKAAAAAKSTTGRSKKSASTNASSRTKRKQRHEVGSSGTASPSKRRRVESLTHSFPPTLHVCRMLKTPSKHAFFKDEELNEMEHEMWSSQWGASYASMQRQPGHVTRFLGKITRTLQVVGKNKTVDMKPSNTAMDGRKAKKNAGSLPGNPKTHFEHLVKAQNPDLSPEQVKVEARRIILNWDHVWADGIFIGKWNSDGEYIASSTDKSFVTASHLLELLKKGVLKDVHADETISHYHGLRQVRVDTVSVLEAILDLSNKNDEPYEIPLIAAYPKWQKVAGNKYRIEIGIYANRLLFEVMTLSLQTIMSAMDEDSYTIREPIVLPPPPPSPPVFCSAPNPAVVVDEDYDNDDDNDDDEEEEVVNIDDEGSKMDVLLGESTRDNNETISAFSTAGLMKLWESPGCDVTAWPSIESKLNGQLKVDLMPHQIHGVCWMLHQEQIDLNSLLWEKREFPDGGTFFYSPAVGQARLELKLGGLEAVSGGILSDEMGLGKTVQILALILATRLKEPTLIIVPPALASQWIAEIEKIAGDSLTWEFFNPRAPADIESSPDIIVTTYQALDQKRHYAAARILTSTSWGRVVLDEMQEIRSSTTAIAKNCEGLRAKRRWMLSGTPIFESIADLQGELCFLRLEPFCSRSADGFFEFAIEEPFKAKSRYGLDTLRILNLLLLRRSKSMTVRESGLPLMSLKPMTITFEPIPQDPSERALYCFLEFLVHSTLRNEEKPDETKNKLFLRLLHELCVSPLFLCGGLGCASQLGTLNRLMVEHNRRVHHHGHTTDRPYSCDEAIRFLGQVIDKARVHDGFVTNQVVGGGGGATRRDRAFESIEDQIAQTEATLKQFRLENSELVSKRATANWHRLLELITTGHLPASPNNEFHRLWKWRYVVTNSGTGSQGLPVMLTRGWRPSKALFETSKTIRAKRNWRRLFTMVTEGRLCTSEAMKSALSREARDPASTRKIHARWRFRSILPEKARRHVACRLKKKKTDRDQNLHWFSLKHPDFFWTRPFTRCLDNIPDAISTKDICLSIIQHLPPNENVREMSVANRVRVRVICDNHHAKVWKAIVEFADSVDYKTFCSKLKTAAGIQINFSGSLPQIEEELQKSKASLESAKAEQQVYPCDMNKRKVRLAEKRLQIAQRGLCVYDKGRDCESFHICASAAFGQLRSILPKYSFSLISSCDDVITNATDKLAMSRVRLAFEEKKLARLEAAQSKPNVPEALQTLSAFEALEALKSEETKNKTFCLVCREALGDGDNSNGIVALTRCGHLCCLGCWEEYVQSKAGEGLNNPPCIACRKPVRPDEVVQVDPSRRDDEDAAFQKRCSEARELVKEASVMLAKSKGQLEPHLWEALYLSICLPSNANYQGHNRYTSIPTRILAHIRQATNHPVLPSNKRFDDKSLALSSKVRALISDLSKISGRSVVFASSQAFVKHILYVLKMRDIGCIGLFTGQSEEESKVALEEWKNDDSCPVLVIQAGAAACGLTLTDASKMFILQPFIKYEEEQQAYGRLHRYGQLNEVECKVYFTPVSVESRLLEWRKVRDASDAENKIVYAQMRSSEKSDNDDDSESVDQTRYLLGLDEGGLLGDDKTSKTDDGSYSESDPMEVDDDDDDYDG